MKLHHIRLAATAVLALGTVATSCRRPEGAATDSLRGADSAAATPSLPGPGDTAILGWDSATSPVTTVPVSPDQPQRAPRTAADTVRGIVAEVGSLPVTSVVVRPAGGRSVTILGPLAREIGRAAGAEVWVSGGRTAEGLAAEQYAVRSVDGEPAVDGALAREGDRLVLVTPAGRRPIARPPAALQGMIGARVWLVGALDGSITSYGVLRDAP
jgi:hypothetical protein